MENTKPQIIFIHGGDSFDTTDEFYMFLESLVVDPYAPEQKRWRDWLKDSVSDTHEFLVPTMPNKLNADYRAWKIWFEKYVPYMRDGITLIGHSLGGGFLLRYLTDNALPVSIKQLHLVAAVIDEVDCPGVGEFKIDVTTWAGFKSDIQEVHLWHSSDDDIVPIHHAKRLSAKFPTATFHTFTDRGHFLQSDFPELYSVIRS